MAIYPRAFYAEEKAAIKFFDRAGKDASGYIAKLFDDYSSIAMNAPCYFEDCKETMSKLASIQNEIDDYVEYMIEKISDWASD